MPSSWRCVDGVDLCAACDRRDARVDEEVRVRALVARAELSAGRNQLLLEAAHSLRVQRLELRNKVGVLLVLRIGPGIGVAALAPVRFGLRGNGFSGRNCV